MTKKEKNTHKEVECLNVVVKRQGEFLNKIVERFGKLEKFISDRD